MARPSVLATSGLLDTALSLALHLVGRTTNYIWRPSNAARQRQGHRRCLPRRPEAGDDREAHRHDGGDRRGEHARRDLGRRRRGQERRLGHRGAGSHDRGRARPGGRDAGVVVIAAGTADPAHRALTPNERGYAEVGGVRIAYEVFGDGEQTILLLPPWAIIHSRFWKLQVPYLARHFRVVTFDPRGNGLSDRPTTTESYGPRRLAQDALAVLAAAGAEHCVLIVHCGSAQAGLLLAADHPEQIRGALF